MVSLLDILKPKHSFESVAIRISNGLINGSVILTEKTSSNEENEFVVTISQALADIRDSENEILKVELSKIEKWLALFYRGELSKNELIELVESEKQFVELQTLTGEINKRLHAERLKEVFIDSLLQGDPKFIAWAYNKALQRTSR